MATVQSGRITRELRDAYRLYEREATTIHQLDNGRWVIAWWDGDNEIYCPAFCAPMWTSRPGATYEEAREREFESLADAYGITTYSTRSNAKRARQRVLGF